MKASEQAFARACKIATDCIQQFQQAIADFSYRFEHGYERRDVESWQTTLCLTMKLKGFKYPEPEKTFNQILGYAKARGLTSDQAKELVLIINQSMHKGFIGLCEQRQLAEFGRDTTQWLSDTLEMFVEVANPK